MAKKPVRMLPVEREEKILELLRSRRVLRINELHSVLPGSKMTIWRDIQKLSRKVNIREFYGGIMLSDTPLGEQEESLENRLSRNPDMKTAAAKRAVKLIKEGETVILDTSSASNYLAVELRMFRRLKVITNCVAVARSLLNSGLIEIHLTGGQLKTETESLIGPKARSFFQDISADWLFFSGTGATSKGEVLDLNPLEIEVKTEMMKSAKRKVLLFDSSKAGSSRGAHILCRFSECDWIVNEKKTQKGEDHIG